MSQDFSRLMLSADSTVEELVQLLQAIVVTYLGPAGDETRLQDRMIDLLHALGWTGGVLVSGFTGDAPHRVRELVKQVTDAMGDGYAAGEQARRAAGDKDTKRH